MSSIAEDAKPGGSDLPDAGGGGCTLPVSPGRAGSRRAAGNLEDLEQPEDPLLASVAHGYNLAVHRDFTWNAIVITAWQFLWGLGIAFTMWTTITPAYLGHLGASRTTLSLVMAIPWICVPFQIASSVWFGGRRRRVSLMLSYMLATIPWLVYAGWALLSPGSFTRTAHLFCYILVSVAFCLGLACGVPLFFEVVTDNTPLLRRGGLAGYRSAAIGVAGLLAGTLSRRLMQSVPAPTSYRVSFVIGLCIWMLSCFVLLGVRDHVDPARLGSTSRSRRILRQFLATTGELWRDVNCRIYLFFHGLLAVTLVTSPMIIDAAGRQLGATAAQQQMFTIVYLLCLIGPAWCVGRLADRFGYRIASVLIAAMMAVGFTLVLCSSSLYVWYAAYGLCGLSASLVSTVLGNMCVEMLPRREPSVLLSTAMTLFLPLVITGVALGGRLGDSQGSYLFVFAMGATLSAIVALGFGLLVTEPRVGRMYVVRMTEQR
jgi:MFS family permease